MADNIEQIITRIATQMGIDPNFALDIARAESSLNPKAVGKAGEVGLYQIHPKYLNYISKTVTGKTYNREQMMDPAINAAVGIGYLKFLRQDLSSKLGSVSPGLLIQTYNQGPGYTKKHGYKITDEMKKHPNKIYRRYLNAE